MPVWIEPEVVLAIHEEQLSEHGGAKGLRDAGAFESALARPTHLWAYGAPDLYDLAAAYACGIAQNHPFTDGNKRTSLVVTELFLMLNGISSEADDATLVVTWLRVADGSMTESELAGWLRAAGQEG